MPTTLPRVLFFDIGGVLLSDGWGHVARQAAAKKYQLDYDEMDRLHDFIFNVYEIGKISLDDYLNIAIFNQPRNFTKDDFKIFMYAQSAELPDTLQWLKEWRRNNSDVSIISINNEGKELNDHRIKKFGLHDCFDAFVSSCEVGMRKPDPGMFKLALGIAQVQPDQCLYFDDRPMLAVAAKQLGIPGFHHESFASTKQIIENLFSQK